MLKQKLTSKDNFFCKNLQEVAQKHAAKKTKCEHWGDEQTLFLMFFISLQKTSKQY